MHGTDSKMQFSSKEMLLTALATLLAFAGLRAEDPWVIYPCLIGSWVCLVLTCYFHKGLGRWRIASGLAITCVFVAFGTRIYLRQLAEEQKDVADHLGFKAQFQSQNNLRSTVVTLINGGKTDIKYSLTCHIKLLVANGNPAIRESDFRNHMRGGTLEAGTGAQYDDCLSSMSVPIQILDCVDIQVRVRYSLETRPSLEELKEHGFVARKIGDKFEWEDRESQQSVSDCQTFVHKKTLSPEDREAQRIAAIRVSNTQILRSHSLNPFKVQAASLSESIFDFADEREKSLPPEPKQEGIGPWTMLHMEEIRKWNKETVDLFNSRHRKRLNETFEKARQIGTNAKGVEQDCSISQMPIWIINNCASRVGDLSKELPN